MGFDELAKGVAVQTRSAPQQQMQRGQYDDGYGYGPDPYPIPNDPYMYRQQPMGPNQQVLSALLDNSLTKEEQLDNIRQLVLVALQQVKRIPNIEMVVVKSLQRDWGDIVELMGCQGTEEMVLEMMVEFLFELASLGAYGGAELKGISTIGALVTQKQIADQTIKYPQEQIQQKKRVFGLF